MSRPDLLDILLLLRRTEVESARRQAAAAIDQHRDSAQSAPSSASCSTVAASAPRPRHRSRCSPSSEGFYNPSRRRSALGYLSPIEHEARAMAKND